MEQSTNQRSRTSYPSLDYCVRRRAAAHVLITMFSRLATKHHTVAVCGLDYLHHTVLVYSAEPPKVERPEAVSVRIVILVVVVAAAAAAIIVLVIRSCMDQGNECQWVIGQ